MLDTKYYRDYGHNYLIIKDNGCLSQNTYQRKMITENQIKGLLVSRERNINGEILLYYEITSRQSLSSIYDNKSICMDQLQKLFVQLKLINDILQKYLLDGSCLVLLPEYIFQNIETEEYYFLYYPDSGEGEFSKLIEYLMSKVDNEDLKAVEIIYKIADLIHREQFVLDEILKWFQEEASDLYLDNNPEYQLQGKKDSREYQIEEEVFEREIKQDEEKTGRKWIDRIISAFLERINRKSISDKKEEVSRYVEIDEDISIHSVVADTGNTVFIPWSESCENKLYSMDKKNKCHIDLEKLPLTVGKLAGAVDIVINESSISRMHAKFSKHGNKIYITDLNSTNGTFQNGMKLTPNASEIIEPGDEIRLGKLKFIYR